MASRMAVHGTVSLGLRQNRTQGLFPGLAAARRPG